MTAPHENKLESEQDEKGGLDPGDLDFEEDPSLEKVVFVEAPEDTFQW